MLGARLLPGEKQSRQQIEDGGVHAALTLLRRGLLHSCVRAELVVGDVRTRGAAVGSNFRGLRSLLVE